MKRKQPPIDKNSEEENPLHKIIGLFKDEDGDFPKDSSVNLDHYLYDDLMDRKSGRIKK